MRHAIAICSVSALFFCSILACFGQSTVAPIGPTPEGLHPAFRLSGSEVSDAISRGTTAANKGKKLDQLVSPYRESPRWTKGKGGKAHESAVWCLSFNGTPFALTAYNKRRLYEKLDIPDTYTANGACVTMLVFAVTLQSMPRHGRFIWEKNKAADEGDVQVEKFVLTDDLGTILESKPGATSSEASSGSVTFSGVRPLLSTGRIQTNSTVSGTVSSPNGTASVSGFGSAYSTYSRTQYVPWSESAPYYVSKYVVKFSLFDNDGKPLLRPETKTITLHIINRNGEMEATFKLPTKK